MRAVLIHRATNSQYLVAQSGESFFLLAADSRYLPDFQVGDPIEFEMKGYEKSLVRDMNTGKSFDASYILAYPDKFTALTAAFELGWEDTRMRRKSAKSAA
jgi:hypothetical protein